MDMAVFAFFATFWRCVPRQGRGLVWAHGRGTCLGLLADRISDPGLPSHPPALLSWATVCADVMPVGSPRGSRSGGGSLPGHTVH
jgi:hypothetical protein